ncbi:hypothetical protein FNF31_00256 [Cafeteria roenbergensis]|uniref:Uncharacterized protein n=1 Tax=Cafeteria roenbergensis TaxID=33653 RepID=A0A5A8DUN7_CAFRO|nr:hypothetical protein FNF31_00256 [Cafeteria roenbergensis]
MRALLAALLVSLGTQLALSARQYDDGEMMVPQQGMLGPSWGGWGGLSMFGGLQFDPREAQEAELDQARFMGSSSGNEGEEAEAESDETDKPEAEDEKEEGKSQGEDDGEAKTGAALRTHMAELSKQSAELERRAAELKDKERKLDESLKRAAAAADGAKAAPNASVVTALTVALPTLTTPPISVRTAEASDNATCPSSRTRLSELLDTLRQGFTLSAEELERTEASIKEAQSKYNATHQQVMSERAERDSEVTKAEVESVERIDADETEALHLIEAELAVAKSRAAGARSLLVKEREIKQADELADQSAHVRDAVAKIEEVLESRLAGLRAQRRSVADGLAAARAERDTALGKVQARLQHAARTIRSKRTEISKISQVATELLGASASIEAGLQKDLHVAADHFRHHDEPIKSSWSPSDAAKASGLDDKSMTAGGPDHATRKFGSEPTGDELEEMRKAIREADIADDHVDAAHTIASEHRLAHDVESVSTGMTVAEKAMEADKQEEATDAEAQEKLAAEAEKKAEEALAGAKEAMEQHEFRQTAARESDAAVMAATGKLSPSFLQAGAKAGSSHAFGPAYMPVAMSSLTPIGYSNPGFQAAAQNALAVQRTVGAMTGAVPYPVPDTPTLATPMGLGPLSSGLTPTEFAAIHGVPTDSYYMPSDLQSTPQAGVYMRDVLAAAARLTGHGGLLSASPSPSSPSTPPTPNGGENEGEGDGGESKGESEGESEGDGGEGEGEGEGESQSQSQSESQSQDQTSSSGDAHNFRQMHSRKVDTSASDAPANDADGSLESMVNDKAVDDMLVKQEDEEETAAASKAEAQLDEASATLDAELGKAKGAAGVNPHSNLMDADAIRLIKGGKAAARVAARVAQRYANTRDTVHTHFETVGHGLGAWTGGKQTADQVLAGEPSFRQRAGHSGKAGEDADLAAKPLNELPFKTIGEAVKTAETLVEGIHKRLQGVDKVRAELETHLTDLQVQRQEAAKKLKSLQEVDRLAEQTAAAESEHAATLSDMDRKIFGLGSDGRADDGMYVCSDGSKRADALSCPSGGTIKWTNLKETRDADGKVKCADGTSRFDGSNCPGGSLLAGPAAEDGKPKDNLADAKAKARAEAERKARRAKMESLQKQIDELDAAIVRLRRLDTEAQAAAEKLRSREKHVGEATDSLVAAAEQRSMLSDQQTQQREKLLFLIRESEDVRRIETELAEEARRKYETHVRTVMRSLKAIELAEADAVLASQRARALANETVSTKGRARLRELHAELNKKDAAISQELKAAVEVSHTEREEASEQRRLAEKTARTRADLLRSRHRVTAAEDVVEAARMRAAGIKAVVVEERKMAARQKDVRERAIKASETTFAAHHASRANSTAATHARARVLLASARRLRRLNAAGKSATRLLRAYLQDASRAENQVLSLAAQGVSGAPADEPPMEEGPTASELVDKLAHSVSSAMASESAVRNTIKHSSADAASAVADANAAAAAAANPDAASFLQLRTRLRGPVRSLLQVQARQEEEPEEEAAEAGEATAAEAGEAAEAEAGEATAAEAVEAGEEADPAAEADAEELQEQAAEEATEEAEAAEAEQAEASAEAAAEGQAAEDVMDAEISALSPEAKKALVAKELALEEAEDAAKKAAEDKAAAEAAAADPAAAAAAVADSAAEEAAAAVEAEKKKEDPAGIPEEAAHVDPNKDILDQPLPPLPRVTSPPAEEVPEDEPMAARVERLERQGKAFADGARRSARTARLLIERISAIRMAADEVTMRLPREELDYFTTRETSATAMAELCQAEAEAFDKYSQTGLQKGAQLLEELAKKATAIEARMAAVGATAKSDSEKQRAKAEAQAERGAKAEIQLEAGMAAAKHDGAEEATATAEPAQDAAAAAPDAAPAAVAAATEGAAAEATPASEAAAEPAAAADAAEAPAGEAAAATEAAAAPAAAEATAAEATAEAGAEATSAAAPDAVADAAAAEPAAETGAEAAEPAAAEAEAATTAEGAEAAVAAPAEAAEPTEASLLQSSAHVFGAVRQNRRRLRGGLRRQDEEAAAAAPEEAAATEAAAEPEAAPAEEAEAEAEAEPEEAAVAEEAAGEAGEEAAAAPSAEAEAAAVVDSLPSEADESAEEVSQESATAGVEPVDVEAQAEAEAVAETDGTAPRAAAAAAAAAESAAPAKAEEAAGETAEADVLGFPAHERVLENAEDAVEAAEEELEMAKAEAARLAAEYMEHRKAALAAGAKLHETGPLPKMEEEAAAEEEEEEEEQQEGAAPEEATEEAVAA